MLHTRTYVRSLAKPAVFSGGAENRLATRLCVLHCSVTDKNVFLRRIVYVEPPS